MAGKSDKACCVLTLPLLTEPWQEHIIEKRFRIMEHLKNSLIALELRKLKNIQRTKQYRQLEAEISNAPKENRKTLYKKRNELLKNAGFSEFAFINDMTNMQKHFVEHIATQIAHKSASDVWNSFEKVLFNTGRKIHFIRRGSLSSIACKKDGNGMRFRNGMLHWNGGQCKNKVKLELRVACPKTPYECAMLEKKIKYERIIRKWVKTRYKYYVQFTLDGNAVPKPRKTGTGRVGIDIGPSSIAIASSQEVRLMELADNINQNHLRKVALQQKMDRSRRATNPDNFNENKTIRRGVKLSWHYSKHYQKLRGQVRELERKNADIRKYQHTCLANYILSLGTEVYIEQMNFKGLQARAKETTYNKNGRANRKKRFGKSIANRAPAMLVTILETKLKSYAGTELHKVNTWSYRASQYDHITDTYTKKLLRQRWAELGNGDRIQRDLYSAFLLMNSQPSLQSTDRERCSKTYSQFKSLHDQEIYRLQQTPERHLSSFGIA